MGIPVLSVRDRNGNEIPIPAIKGDKGDSGIYIGSDDMPAGYNVQIDPNGSAFELPETDQIYNPESKNAQSGTAVAEAFALKDFELLSDLTITEDIAEVVWNTTDSGEPLTNYKDFFIYFKGTFTESASQPFYCRANNGGLYFMYLTFAKSTSLRGFWLHIENIFNTDKIDAYENHNTYKGLSMYKSVYPQSLLLNVQDLDLALQGTAEHNRNLYSDFILGGKNEHINKLHIGQSGSSIFATGSRFLLFGRKA